MSGRVDQLGAPGSPLNQIAPGAGTEVQRSANNVLNQLTAPINLWQAGFDASWELDLFGRVRRSVEAANAQTESAMESRNDALLSLEAEVAQTYVQLRGAQAQLDLAQRLVDEQNGVLTLTQSQAKVGLASEQEVRSAAAQLETTRAQLPQFEQQIVQALNGLAYLLAETPGALDAELSTPAAVPPVPPAVATGVPGTLARRRPDIRRAEADLHAATANVGVSVAQFYPDISLTGQIGLRGTHASDLSRWVASVLFVRPIGCRCRSSRAARWSRICGCRRRSRLKPRSNTARPCCSRCATSTMRSPCIGPTRAGAHRSGAARPRSRTRSIWRAKVIGKA